MNAGSLRVDEGREAVPTRNHESRPVCGLAFQIPRGHASLCSPYGSLERATEPAALTAMRKLSRYCSAGASYVTSTNAS